MATITIKELHAKTGEEVRKAGKSRKPVAVTDRGKLIAVLTAPICMGLRLGAAPCFLNTRPSSQRLQRMM